MSKTSKILKCTCIDFRRSIEMHTAEVGLDIVDDEEVEVDRIEEDEEVARIYEDAKDKH